MSTDTYGHILARIFGLSVALVLVPMRINFIISTLGLFVVMSVSAYAQSPDRAGGKLSPLPKISSDISGPLGQIHVQTATEFLVFPNLKEVLGKRTADYEKFLNVVAANTEVFDQMDIATSEANRLSLSFEGRSITMNAYDASRKTLSMGHSNCETNEGLDFIPVQIHEYSHSLFEPNLQKRLAGEFAATAENDKTYFKKVLMSDPSAESVQVGMRTVSHPFNELFADTATILILNDPKALSEFFLKCSDLKDHRDFSHSYPVAGWDVGRLGGMMDNRHQVFNPTRSYIWKVYASKLGSQKEGRAALLKAVFEASIIVMKEIYETNMTVNQWAVVNQESLNKRLIELIDARL